MKKPFKLALFASSSFVAAMPSLASGQEVADIIVTAQKRSENLQSVPVSVSAITADTLASQGIRSSTDLQAAVPGIAVQRQNSVVHIFIRGIGTTGGNAGQEAATAVFVDGIYLPSMQGATFSLNNIERIEVLKGPQGTLYGRNATAGAVNVITRTPSFQTKAQAEFGFGNYEQVEANTYLTTGLTSNLAADLAVRYYNQDKGFVHNVTTGQDVQKAREFDVRSKLYYDGETTKVTLAGDYSTQDTSLGIVYRQLPSSVNLLGRMGWPYGHRDVESDTPSTTRIKNYGVSLRVEQDIGELSLTSITAQRWQTNTNNVDYDTTPLPILPVMSVENDKQFTQELQLSSNGDRFKWIVGLFYLNGYGEYNPFTVSGLALLPFQAQEVRARQTTTSYAAYGQGTYNITDNTRLTVGLRYTYDKRKFQATNVLKTLDGSPDVPLMAPRRESSSFKKPQWRFAVDHDLSDTVMVYGSYSRGVKSGVYNTGAPDAPFVLPETLDAFEVGVKSSLFDRRIRLNVAGFYYKYKDIQLTKLAGARLDLLNAANAESYGIEAEFEAAITDGLTLRGGGQILHARYKKFDDVPLIVPTPGGMVTIDCTPNPSICDGSGNHMIKAPDYSANLSADYTTAFAGGKLGFTVSYSYSGRFYWEPSNRLSQKPYSLVNGQIKWTTEDDRFHVRLWTRNLFDAKYFSTASEAITGDIAVAAPPRTFGISTGFSF